MKSKAGRKRIEKELQKRRDISISDRLVTKAREIGKGNLSEGIRTSIEAYGHDNTNTASDK